MNTSKEHILAELYRLKEEQNEWLQNELNRITSQLFDRIADRIVAQGGPCRFCNAYSHAEASIYPQNLQHVKNVQMPLKLQVLNLTVRCLGRRFQFVSLSQFPAIF